jgi:hypothetical protein
MPVTVTDAQRAAIRSSLDTIKEELAGLRSDMRDAETTRLTLSDEDREACRDRLIAESDTDLVSTLLALHKTIELRATGDLRGLLEYQAVVLHDSRGEIHKPSPW